MSCHCHDDYLCGEHAEELRTELAALKNKQMKDHEIREMINSLRDVACQFHDHQSLRERIAHVVLDAMKRNAGDDKN